MAGACKESTVSFLAVVSRDVMHTSYDPTTSHAYLFNSSSTLCITVFLVFFSVTLTFQKGGHKKHFVQRSTTPWNLIRPSSDL